MSRTGHTTNIVNSELNPQASRRGTLTWNTDAAHSYVVYGQKSPDNAGLGVYTE
jgi:hypothetical protein